MTNKTSKTSKTNKTKKSKSPSPNKDPANIIGFGSFGCVTKPSLTCKKGTVKKNIVSKLMSKKDALDEMKEMEKITKIPNIQKFILSKPTQCVPKHDAQFQEIFKDCQSVSPKVEENKDHPENMRLLLLEDGGVNLEDFHTRLIQKHSANDQKQFFTSILNLIEGVVFFRDNNIVHRDIKTQNIVYNVSTGTIKYIDFGLMINAKDLIKKCKTNKNDLGISWFNFPTETSCSNVNTFYYLKKCQKYQRLFKSFDQFINKFVYTFDTYSLTLALKTMFFHFVKNPNICPTIAPQFFKRAFLLMGPYCHSDLHKRNSRMEELHKDYGALLKEFKIFRLDAPTPTQDFLNQVNSFYSMNSVSMHTLSTDVEFQSAVSMRSKTPSKSSSSSRSRRKKRSRTPPNKKSPNKRTKRQRKF